jgi:hypothetical protein
MNKSLHVLKTNVIFHWVMWKKQAPDACFNVFLVLLLNSDSIAIYLSGIWLKQAQSKKNFRSTIITH